MRRKKEEETKNCSKQYAIHARFQVPILAVTTLFIDCVERDFFLFFSLRWISSIFVYTYAITHPTTQNQQCKRRRKKSRTRNNFFSVSDDLFGMNCIWKKKNETKTQNHWNNGNRHGKSICWMDGKDVLISFSIAFKMKTKIWEWKWCKRSELCTRCRLMFTKYMCALYRLNDVTHQVLFDR